MIQGMESERNRERFDRLAREHRSSLLGYCQGLIADPDDAADVLQDGLVYAWEEFGNFDGSNFLAWSKRLMRFCALRKREDNARHAHEDLDDLVRREMI